MFAACSPQDVREIVGKLVQQAKDGDVQAARTLLDRLFGRPREAASDVSIELPDLNSAEQIHQATRLVVQSVASGDLPANDGRTIVDLLSAVLESSEVAATIEQAEALTWQRG